MVQEIVSSENKKFKLWQKLQKKKYRYQESLYLIEEVNLIEEAFKNEASIEAVIVEQGCFEQLPETIDSSLYEQCDIYLLPQQLFSQLSTTETTRGVMAVVAMKESCIEDFFNQGRSTNMLILDRLQDPGNVGTIIRTADAAGFAGIVVVKGTCDIYSPKVVRSAAGSLFRVPIVFVNDAEEAIELAHSQGNKVVVSCFERACNYTEAPLGRRAAIVIGNEGQGVSKKFLTHADYRVKIPMFGTIESLNASVAAAILMYESVNQAFPEGF